jgi:hypothetical protein
MCILPLFCHRSELGNSLGLPGHFQRCVVREKGLGAGGGARGKRVKNEEGPSPSQRNEHKDKNTV